MRTLVEGDAGGLDCEGLEQAGCQDCSLLIQPPKTEAECLINGRDGTT
jgi:hypothetical protein